MVNYDSCFLTQLSQRADKMMSLYALASTCVHHHVLSIAQFNAYVQRCGFLMHQLRVVLYIHRIADYLHSPSWENYDRGNRQFDVWTHLSTVLYCIAGTISACADEAVSWTLLDIVLSMTLDGDFDIITLPSGVSEVGKLRFEPSTS